MNKPVFQMSSDTRLLYQRLVKAQVGDIISYVDLSEAIGTNVLKTRPALYSAIRKARKDDDMVFAVVRRIGVKRLGDEEIVSASTADVAGIRRKVHRAAEKLTKVSDYAAMSKPKQLDHTVKLSILAAMSEMTSERAMKKVESAAAGRAGELPIAETLDAFRKKT